MADRTDYPSLRERTATLLINLAIAYAAYIAAAGRWLPSGGLESVWLLSAFALWFFSLLSAPWFIPPRDALANAIAAGAILVTIDLAPSPGFRAPLEVIRWISAGYCVVVTIVSLVALFLHDRDQRTGAGRFAFRLTGIFGRGEILYTPPALISILGAYQASVPTVGWLVLLWGHLGHLSHDPGCRALEGDPRHRLRAPPDGGHQNRVGPGVRGPKRPLKSKRSAAVPQDQISSTSRT